MLRIPLLGPFLAHVAAGLRWWMVPLLIALLGGTVALLLLSSLSGVSPTRYTTF
jgi:hypothetical protein